MMLRLSGAAWRPPVSHRAGLTAAAALVASLAVVAPAVAGGMYLPTRGVRPTGRGGAFVAGADDVSSLWWNPAGLARLDRATLLLDAAFVGQAIDYERIDYGGNPQPAVSNKARGLPVPSLGYARALGDRAVIGGGLWAPYAGLARFDEGGAQRYSSVDLSKSIIATVGVGVAVRLGSRFRVGVTVQDHIVSMQSSIMLSGCPGETICAPEDPDFDSLNRVDQDSLANPSGSIGIQLDATDQITFGAAFQLPVWVRGSGKLHTRLPRSGFFDGASVEGDRADISFDLPASIRAGLEVRPGRWRIEAAATIELWSQHDRMVIEPREVRIVGAPGVGTYELGPMVIPREYANTVAAHLGVEGRPSASLPLTVRAGYAFETAAAPDRYLSVLTVDGQKHLAALGAGYQAGPWQFDVVLGYARMAPRTVATDVGEAPQLNPIRDTSTDPLTVYVNWGDYRSSWLLAGLGVARSL